MKIELTIKSDYLPGWGLHEGVRELLQNAKDAEVEFSAPMSVRMRDDVLIVENEGCTMPYDALLLGHSTKTSRGDLIGKFGEGFKLGILALIRAGHSVKIRNGAEVWTPTLDWSEKFSSKVLIFNIQGGRKDENRVQIEISGINPEYFKNEIKPRFLWLDKDGRRAEERVETCYGTLLLSERYKGKLYVKGIFVENKPDLTVGYDLQDADVDRDRRMVGSYDFGRRSRLIWETAVATRPDLLDPFFQLIELQSPEMAGFDGWDARRLSPEIQAFVVNKFTERNGSDAIAVRNLGESAELDHFGKKGVICSEAMRAVVETKQGDFTAVKAALAKETVKVYSWSELSDLQKENLKRAISLVNPHAPVGLEMVEVCDFRSENLLGMHSAGKVSLSAKVLTIRSETLATLVHEVAHENGKDGEKGHVAEIERIWAGIVEALSKP
jgi:hypothetical protein